MTTGTRSASTHADDNFHTLVGDVLTGRCSLVKASGTGAFGNVV